MKKIILTLIVLGVLGAGTYAYCRNKGQVEPTVTTLQITRGDMADTVQATGTLQALRQVNVGTQVSGVVQNLYVDFNHIVKAGQIIARLDPSIIQTQIEQREASVTRAESDLDILPGQLGQLATALDPHAVEQRGQIRRGIEHRKREGGEILPLRLRPNLDKRGRRVAVT